MSLADCISWLGVKLNSFDLKELSFWEYYRQQGLHSLLQFAVFRWTFGSISVGLLMFLVFFSIWNGSTSVQGSSKKLHLSLLQFWLDFIWNILLLVSSVYCAEYINKLAAEKWQYVINENAYFISFIYYLLHYYHLYWAKFL